MLEDLKNWVSPVSGLLAIGSFIYTWLTARANLNAGALVEHGKKLTDHDRRIQAVESELAHLPSKDVVNALNVAIVRLEGTVNALDMQVTAVNRTVANIDGYLRGDERK